MSGWGLSGIGRMVCLERMRILTLDDMSRVFESGVETTHVCLQRCFEEDGLKARWVFPMGLQHHSQSVRRDFGGEVGILRHWDEVLALRLLSTNLGTHFSNPSELEIASSFSRWANVALNPISVLDTSAKIYNPYVIGSVLGCGGDDGFLDNGFVPLTIDEGPVEGRSFLRTAAPGGLLLTGMYLSPGRWVPGEREDATGDEMTSRSFPLDFPYCWC